MTLVDKSPNKTKSRVGRPLKDIDPEQVFRLAELGASARDIGYVLKCDHKTVLKRCRAQVQQGQASRRTRLREFQWKAAKSGNVTMLIWLGKNELGQQDKATVEHGGGVRVNVVYRSPDAANGND